MAQSLPLMPKATAAWLYDNTELNYQQIADFCGLHPLEVEAIANGDINIGKQNNPVLSGELSQEEITRCEKSANSKLKMLKNNLPKPKARAKGPRYTPVAKRAEKPNAIAFLIKEYPQLADVQVARLVGSTKPTVAAIRDRSHPNTTNLKPNDPVLLGLCSADDLQKAIQKADRRVAREEAAAEKEAAPIEVSAPAVDVPADVSDTSSTSEEQETTVL